MKKLVSFAIVTMAGLCLFEACKEGGESLPDRRIDVKINSKVEFIIPSSRAAATRAAWPNQNEWSTKYSVPNDITLEESHAVYEYFAAHSKDLQGQTSVNYTNFFVQHVWRGTDPYGLEDMNHAQHTVTGGNQMDQLWAGNDDHVNNFNACSGSIMCMENSSTSDFSYNDSYGNCGKESGNNSTRHNKYIILNVPGYGTYLGFDYETYKGSGERHEGDGVYTDWIIKICQAVAPGSGSSSPDESDHNSGSIVPDEDGKIVVGNGSVEFDIHQQEHQDWNEIKTSIHIRDTVNCRVLIPIPQDLQAEPDDFAIRLADKYEYICKKIEIDNHEYTVNFSVGHIKEGIEITVGTAGCPNAMKAAREVFGDGLTFEVHTYVKPTVTTAEVWALLRQTKCPQTSLSLWAQDAPFFQSSDKDVVTHTYGQVSSAYYPSEIIKFDVSPTGK